MPKLQPPCHPAYAYSLGTAQRYRNRQLQSLASGVCRMYLHTDLAVFVRTGTLLNYPRRAVLLALLTHVRPGQGLSLRTLLIGEGSPSFFQALAISEDKIRAAASLTRGEFILAKSLSTASVSSNSHKQHNVSRTRRVYNTALGTNLEVFWRTSSRLRTT